MISHCETNYIQASSMPVSARKDLGNQNWILVFANFHTLHQVFAHEANERQISSLSSRLVCSAMFRYWGDGWRCNTASQCTRSKNPSRLQTEYHHFWWFQCLMKKERRFAKTFNASDWIWHALNIGLIFPQSVTFITKGLVDSVARDKVAICIPLVPVNGITL